MIPLWRFCIAACHYSAFLSLADHQGWIRDRIHHFKVAHQMGKHHANVVTKILQSLINMVWFY